MLWLSQTILKQFLPSDAATILSPSMERVVGIGNSGIFITVTVVLILWVTKFWLRKLRLWCPFHKSGKHRSPGEISVDDDLEAGPARQLVAPYSASPSKYAKGRLPRMAKSGKYVRGGVIGGLSMALYAKAAASEKRSSVTIQELPEDQPPKRMPRRSSPRKLSMLREKAAPARPPNPPKSWVDASSGRAPEQQDNCNSGSSCI
ncbi:Oidioi.mRNA.OKI2018_I69.chr1.g2867.t1.cds [Oikopleura dioica]|uniref:Oidioi.mRNA.OKI2018_I69.chr1.g2867.t1.cds n=1 Tax=Oikopleura dioica TaxID=34765 RepID=A0ABN7SZ98_OIKDI|nr:Oidioi.mRNA.OKI2018_I69.chr1.g2867.t1.cds [Oikopleura dioica]